MSQSKITIFSVFHKAGVVPSSNFIQPIQVGRALTNIDLGFIADNTGNNISSKNEFFCELTALYWIWQNLSVINSGYIGLSHYRRNFVLPMLSKSPFKKYSKTDVYFGKSDESTLKQFTSPELETAFLKHLEKGKIILPIASKTWINTEYLASVKDHFIYNHIQEEWELMEETVLKLYPDYEISFEKFKNSREIFCYNMFIGNKTFISNYCTWLFNILFELEKKVKVSAYKYQSRIFGFFSERLLNLFILHNKLKTAQFPVVLIQ